MRDGATKRSCIFIVDDFPGMRAMLTLYLEKGVGLHVCGSAASGEEALSLLHGLSCDLALIDVSMPGMGGIELVRRLQAERPWLKCLIFSGHDEQRDVSQAQEAGAHGYVVKDDWEKLDTAIRQVLAGKVYLSEAVKSYWLA
jgi:DNA-binding NarL/FixJ family response regulator